MTKDTKDILKSVGINAAGTVVGAVILGLLAFLVGKFNFVVVYLKEILIFLLVIFIVLTLFVWFRKLLKLEKELECIKNAPNPKMQPDNSKDIILIKTELAKKADKGNVPSKAEFKDLSRTVKEFEIFVHAQKGQRGEFLGWIEVLKEDIDDDSWRIEATLEELEKTVSRIKLENNHITDIEEQLCRLDNKPKYNFLVAKIRKHYQE